MQPVHIFVSYAHEDARWFKEGFLIPGLERKVQFEGGKLWYDQKRLGGGDPWRKEIERAIAEADIALLLISRDFLLSVFIREVELRLIQERADRGDLITIPILVGYCDWKKDSFLSKFQMVPAKATPLVEYYGDLAKWDWVQNEIHEAVSRQIGIVRGRKAPGPATPVEVPHPTDAGRGKPAETAVREAEPTPARRSREVDRARLRAHAKKIPVQRTPVEAGLQAAVQTAVDSVGFQWDQARVAVLGGGIEKVLKDKNSGEVWLPLYQTWKGKELPALCDILRKPVTRHMDDDIAHWKALLLVRCSLRTPEARDHATEVVQVICDHSLRGDYAVGEFSVLCAALDALAEAPVDDAVKWEGLVAAIESGEIRGAGLVAHRAAQYAPSDGEGRERTRLALASLLNKIDGLWVDKVVEELDKLTKPEDKEEMRLWLLDLLYVKRPHHKRVMIGRIVRLTPESEREPTAERLLRLLDRRPGPQTAGAILKAFDDWKYRQSIPELRKLLPTMISQVAGPMARLLAKWEDMESAPAIRQAIDKAVHGGVTPGPFDFDGLLTSLYGLEGPQSASYIADAFLAVSKYTQKEMLKPTLGIKFRRIGEEAVANAIRKLAQTASDPEVKKAAQEFLAKEG